MFTVNGLSKRFGDSVLFDNVTFSINAGDRIGLVGPNGAGKSTLLRILVGDEPADAGSISCAPNTTVGYLRQGFADIPHGTLADLLDVPTGGLLSAYAELERSTALLADPLTDPDAAATAFEAASACFEASGGYAALDEVHVLLEQFGLDHIALDRPLGALSGGQKTRAGLAGLLAARPGLLVLDEPTNHLDRDGLAWLTAFLEAYRGAVIVVSHDRGFLDAVATRIFALDPVAHSLVAYAGNYSAYMAARRREEDEAEAAWKRQQADVARINRDIRAAESKARTIESSTIDYAVRKKAAKIARPAVVRKKKLERMLDSTEAAEKPVRRWGMDLAFAGQADGARDVATLQGVNVALGGREVLHDVTLQVRHGDRLALTGPNGSGKTTLLRLLTGDLMPDSGTVRIGANVRVGYLAQEQQTLDPSLTILQQAERIASGTESDLRTFLHKFLFGGDTVHRCIADLSYGERTRLMLALLALQETNLLLLDEPLNHLDIEAREQFEQALAAFSGTIVMVVHDDYTVARLANRSVELRDGRLVPDSGRVTLHAE